MGYYITPKEVISEEDAEEKVTEAEDMKDGKNTHMAQIS